MRFDEDYYKSINLDYLETLTGYDTAKEDLLSDLKNAVSAKHYSYDGLKDNAKKYFVSVVDEIESTIDNAELYRCHKLSQINTQYDTRTNRRIEAVYSNSNRQNYNDYERKVSYAKEEIKQNVSIEDVLQAYYFDGSNRKSNNMCLCPFHNENTPSFHFDNKKNLFHCFGCGESGDQISFVQKFFNIGYVDAVKMLDGDFGLHNLDYVMNEKIEKRISEKVTEANKIREEKLKQENEYNKLIDEYYTYEPIASKKFDRNTPEDELYEIIRARAKVDELQYKLDEIRHEEYVSNHPEEYAEYLESENNHEGAEYVRNKYIKPKQEKKGVAELTAKLDITVKPSKEGSFSLAYVIVKVNDRFSFPVTVIPKKDNLGNYLLYPNYKNGRGEYQSYIQPADKKSAELISSAVLSCFDGNKIVSEHLTVGQEQAYSTVKIVRMTPLPKDNQLNNAIGTVCLDNLINMNCVNVRQYSAKEKGYANYVNLPVFSYNSKEIVNFFDKSMLDDLKNKCIESISGLRANYYSKGQEKRKSKGMSL